MKRSKRNLHLWLNETYRFQESVIHVEDYLHIIKDELNQIERELLFFKGGVLLLFTGKSAAEPWRPGARRPERDSGSALDDGHARGEDCYFSPQSKWAGAWVYDCQAWFGRR